MWHVAVVALAAGGIGCMVCMFRNLLLKFLMALQASVIPIHAARQLIIRITVMHGVARQATHATFLSLTGTSFGYAGGFNHRQVFAPTDAQRSILPER
jgi:hypothetical protein